MKRTFQILLIISLLSCNRSGDSLLELSLLYKRLLNLNRPMLTLNGKAQMTGSIKNATVQARTIPTSGTDAGKCNGTAGSSLANGITSSGDSDKNNGGTYSLIMERPDANLVCIVVTPTSASTTYSPFRRKVFSWTVPETASSNSTRIVSVVTFSASNTTNSIRLNTNVNPLTNMGAGKFSSLVKYRLSANQLNPSIHTKSNELILQTLSNADLESLATTANEYIGEIFFGASQKFDPSKANLSDPTSSDYDSTNAKVFLATLGGLDSVVSDVLKGKGISDSSGQEVTSSYNSYTNILIGDILGDGKLDGKNVLDDSGSALAISSEYTAIASSPLANIASGMKSYLLQASSFTSDDGTGITWTSSDLSNSALIGGNVLASGGSASAIAYLSASYTLARGVPMTTLTPVIASTVTNCISTPALPTGLSINANTCAISGTPTVEQASTAYTISAGSLSGVVNITILSAPTAISYVSSPYFFTNGIAITALTPTITGVATTCTASPTLPTGLSISATCVIGGTPSQGTALTDYTITATNVAGSISAVIRMRTFFSVPKFTYSFNYATHNISAYSIDPSTGVLTSAGAVAAGTNVRGGMADPTGKFLYVVSKGSSEIRAFSINPTTGGITLVGGPVATASPEFVFIHPTGKFAYVANNGGTISYFSINTDGTLNSVGSVGAGSNTYYVRVDREGKFAYAVSNGTTQIFSYSINQATGALTQVGGPVSTVGGDPRTVEIDPTNTYMYSANFASNAIALFTIHPTTGLLTYVNSYATSIPGLESISVDSTGKYLYFTRDTAQIGVMTINQSTGALTITTNATSGANNWVRLFPDPSGKFIYGVSWNGGTINYFSINQANGDLTPGPIYSAGTNPNGVTVTGAN